MIYKHIFVNNICKLDCANFFPVCCILLMTSFLNELDLICLHTTTGIVSTQLNGFNCEYLTLILLYQSFVCTQYSDYKYCYLTLTILVNTIYSFAHCQMVPSNAMLYQ